MRCIQRRKAVNRRFQDQLLPGVLHAYTATVDAYVNAVPEPQAWLLMMSGLFAVGAAAKRRR